MRASLDAILTRSYQLLGAAASHVPGELSGPILAHMGDLQVLIRREREQARAGRVVFRPHDEPHVWKVGADGGARLVPAGAAGRGVVLAWLAMAGLAPRCCDFFGGDGDPERSARRAVHESAAAWAEHAGCPELAGTLLAVRGKGGRLVHAKSAGGPEIVLGDVRKMSARLRTWRALPDHALIVTHR